MSFIVVLSCALVPFYASAAELVKVEKMSFEGEEFEVETWLDKDGIEYTTIPTPVENKVGIINYLDSLKDDRSESPSIGESLSLNESAQLSNTDYYPWRPDNFFHSDDLGKLEWSAHGWSSITYLGVAHNYGMEIARSPMKGMYLGIGNPDRIINSYSYTFRGIGMTISWPPALNSTSNTATWKSEPVTGTWKLEHDSLAASASSYLGMNGLDISAYSDIYKGGKIYRPQLNKSISYGGLGK